MTLTWVAQWLRLALSNRPNRVIISFPSPEDRNTSCSWNMFSSYLEFWALDKVQKPSDSETWSLHDHYIFYTQCLKNIQKWIPSAGIPHWSIGMFTPVWVWEWHSVRETSPERLNGLCCWLWRLWDNRRSSCSGECWLFTRREVGWRYRRVRQRSRLHILVVLINRWCARAFFHRPPCTEQKEKYKIALKTLETLRRRTTDIHNVLPFTGS
jgi:hypothetical protein